MKNTLSYLTGNIPNLFSPNFFNMKVTYFVYNTSDGKTFVFRNEKPPAEVVKVQKFRGRKAQVEAIFRTTGDRLPEGLSESEINAYITDKLYKTPAWGAYLKNRQDVYDETEERLINYSFYKTVEIFLDEGENPDAVRTIRKVQKMINELESTNNG